MRTILLVVMALLMCLAIPMPEGADVESDALPVVYGLCPLSEICGEAERQEAVVPMGGRLEDALQPNMGSPCDMIAHNGQAVAGPGVRPRPA